MIRMLKKDLYIFGLAMGILSPVGLFLIIWVLNLVLFKMGVAKYYLDTETHVLLSIAGNLVPIRYYFVNLGFDKTGRGVLLVTFLLILIFFALKDYIIRLL